MIRLMNKINKQTNRKEKKEKEILNKVHRQCLHHESFSLLLVGHHNPFVGSLLPQLILFLVPKLEPKFLQPHPCCSAWTPLRGFLHRL